MWRPCRGGDPNTMSGVLRGQISTPMKGSLSTFSLPVSPLSTSSMDLITSSPSTSHKHHYIPLENCIALDNDVTVIGMTYGMREWLRYYIYR